jgi:FkbM family methyltransferase
MKELIRSLAAKAGYRISRGLLPNRFSAMDEVLGLLKRQGHDPKVLLDGGANVGAWTRYARGIFPAAAVHAFEPQPGCRAALEQMARELPNVTIHPVALTQPGVKSVSMRDADAISTGASVVTAAEAVPGESSREVPAATLDELVGDVLRPTDNALLKLDLQSHEPYALRGAERTLKSVEVAISEVQFFQVGGNAHPLFLDLALQMREAGFEIYDFVSLAGRPKDQRLTWGDAVFVRRASPLRNNLAWE